MSPRKEPRATSPALARAVDRLWLAFGVQVRDLRLKRGWSVQELARRAGLSAGYLYMIEAGQTGSAEAAARLATALGRQPRLDLADPRAPATRRDLGGDIVHSAMGEAEARHLRPLGVQLGIDVPYQHYQFAGRADLVGWDLDARALLHIENRTRFPDFQEMAGAFNAKRAYLGGALADRLGIRGWRSETHVIAALWSSEVLRALRLREESFRALCPDGPESFAAWWSGARARVGSTSTLVVLDPLANGRQRRWIGLDDALRARPRYPGYAQAAARLGSAA